MRYAVCSAIRLARPGAADVPAGIGPSRNERSICVASSARRYKRISSISPMSPPPMVICEISAGQLCSWPLPLLKAGVTV